MKDISELVKNLKWYGSYADGTEKELMYKAADTIESLYKKQSDSDWIPCSERFPDKVDRYYIVSVKSTVSDLEYTRPVLYDKEGFATRIDEEPIAWQPLPEAYHE